jgi:hypothetical protein
MFIGHYGAAFIAAADRRGPSLPAAFVATQLIDIGFFAFLPLGIEHMRIVPGATAMNPMDLYDMPYTHSLLGAALWGAGFALLLRALGAGWRAAGLAGGVVLSHWLLDLVVHRPDLTLAGSPPAFGFALWNHPAIEMPLEIGLVAAGVALYAAVHRPRGLPLTVLVLVLLALQAINWFGPPPAAVDARLWGVGLFAYALAALAAWWVARTRAAR